MTKKDFYDQVSETMEKGLLSLRSLSAQLEDVTKEVGSGRYNAKYVREVLMPKQDRLRTQIADARSLSGQAVRKICDEYAEDLRSQEVLDPSLMTDDVKLLQSGVKLLRRDILAMLERNAGNLTMTQIIERYCKEHNIETRGIIFPGNGHLIASVQNVPYSAEVALRWADNPSVYQKIMGEGSAFERYFNEESINSEQ